MCSSHIILSSLINWTLHMQNGHYQTSQPSRKNCLNYFHSETIIAFLCTVWKEKSALTWLQGTRPHRTMSILPNVGLLQPECKTYFESLALCCFSFVLSGGVFGSFFERLCRSPRGCAAGLLSAAVLMKCKRAAPWWCFSTCLLPTFPRCGWGCCWSS